MIRIPGRYRPSSYFPSFNSRPAKYRTELLLGGTVLLLFMLVPGSLSVFAQRGRGRAPVLLSIAVTPTDAEILPDRRQQFTARGMYSDGRTHDLTSRVRWSSSAPDVATIGWEGFARTVGEGQTTIAAALGATTGSTTLNVTRFVWTGGMENVRYLYSATLLNNGMVLVAGGCCVSGGVVFATADLYNPSTGAFIPTGSMNYVEADPTATLLNNGMVLTFGSRDDTRADLYNPATGTFSYTSGSLNTSRAEPTKTLLNNGMVLVAGGVASDGGYLPSAELYDPATGTFTLTGSMKVPRWFHTATLLNNGMVLVGGGCTCLLGYDAAGLADAELYNPATGTFSTTGSLNTPRYYSTATLLNNGMVLMVGGQNSSDVLASAELYNPATGTFTPTGSLNTARTRHRATLLNNGTVLLAGGADQWSVNFGQALGSTEVYDPATEIFAPTTDMNAARVWDTATLLNSGLVLIVGGYGVYQYLASAELYEPATLTPPGLWWIPITPEISTLSPGETQRFIATGVFRDGSTQQLASVTWSSSDPTVAQITNDASNHGVALAIAPGTSIIEARAGRVKCRATLTVR